MAAWIYLVFKMAAWTLNVLLRMTMWAITALAMVLVWTYRQIEPHVRSYIERKRNEKAAQEEGSRDFYSDRR